jgi:uncharacterized protein
MKLKEDANDPPVTVDVVRKVKPGCEEKFEVALAEIIATAETFDGHLGTNILRSIDDDHTEYRIIYKFAYMSCLRRWEDSAVRARLLDQLNRYSLGDSKTQILTGLETWFTLPVHTVAATPPPPRYKMVLLSWLVIFPLSNILPPILGKVLAPFHNVPRSAISVMVMAVLMTYVVMPRVTKLFSFWLYPKPKPQTKEQQV